MSYASMAVNDHLVLCKAALIFAVTRWLLSFALNILISMGLFSASSDSFTQASSRRTPSADLKMVKGSLTLTTFGNIQHGLPESDQMSCTVCLNQLKKKSQVWELRNCCHVFHKQCLEKWLYSDGRLTCPLCRTSLLTLGSLQPMPPPQLPSWAVERMLYLFGDDLLP